ncbi:TPA: hypothetical protein N0F65_002462 [Lagenidium giganteum]|uniref:Peptidase A1 domain-containing protein n=1 Tax=Lagenidium giganteum TaxID=4803 RepID=A0AAV2YNV0_9STRA|nr:TPA: hypothetical protein N0F65_002462 [Lagenidium giganteum]
MNRALELRQRQRRFLAVGQQRAIFVAAMEHVDGLLEVRQELQQLLLCCHLFRRQLQVADADLRVCKVMAQWSTRRRSDRRGHAPLLRMTQRAQRMLRRSLHLDGVHFERCSIKMMKKSVVKNRAPAPIQITAEQILREAQDRKDDPSKPTRRRITDAEELDEYRMGKRRSFEDEIRRQRHHIGTWMKYAAWEESQQEFKRARSIFERAIDVDYKNPTVWLKYAEMEMRHKFVNHARNVWDRAVSLLPRIAQFWYKYAFMEEMVGNLSNARRVFERWMEWQPDDQAWYSYIKLELRAGDIARARQLYERYVACHPAERSYLKYAKWEEKQQHQLVLARGVYERALAELRDDEKSELIYIAFAQFEERCREIERARAIYKHALDKLPKEEAPQLYNAFIAFEKQHGDKKRIEQVVIAKRRVVYEKQVAANSLDYDSWLEYIKLEENEAVVAQSFGLVREVYERAIANVPPLEEKKYWRRYIYLWIKYALMEELLVTDETPERIQQVYQTCLKLIPHEKFTFAKIWVLYAKFLLRQRDVAGARMVLGQSIGKCPKKKLFRSYIELEYMMGEIDRCRRIYEKYLEFDPQNCETWQKYAMLERQVGDADRARAIYELAITQPVLDMPEMIWKAYIDFEIENDEIERTRTLYERLLERTKHVKVWISFAQFEANYEHDAARDVFERALRYLKEQGDDKKEERALCVDTWLGMEQQWGDAKMLKKVQGMVPRKVTKERVLYNEDGTEQGTEEYIDYVFPDDEQAQSYLKLLQASAAWKKKREREEQPAARPFIMIQLLFLVSIDNAICDGYCAVASDDRSSTIASEGVAMARGTRAQPSRSYIVGENEKSQSDVTTASSIVSEASLERRHALAKEIAMRRQEQVMHLHHGKSAHLIDNFFSFIMGNMAIVCWVIGGVYFHRTCSKPLASFMIVLGCLAPFPACTPILLRQWFYLHLRLNMVSISIFIMDAMFCLWFFLGQEWAFESSATTCDEELVTATNAVVFILFVAMLLYLAKVVWYLLLRVRYRYYDLCMSCFRDPFPNTLALSDEEFDELEKQLHGLSDSLTDASQGKSKKYKGKKRGESIQNELRRYQQEIRAGMERLAHASSMAVAGVVPRSKTVAAPSHGVVMPAGQAPPKAPSRLRKLKLFSSKRHSNSPGSHPAPNALVSPTLAAAQTIKQQLYGLPTGLAYYVEVGIGGEPFVNEADVGKNVFNLLVDTGSSNTAVVSPSCCSGTKSTLYSCSASSSCQSTTSTIAVNYITGSWSGTLVTDTISAPSLGSISAVPLTEIQQQSNFVQPGYDGIVGFAYRSIASPAKNPPEPYFDKVMTSKNIPNMFSMLMCGALQSLAGSTSRMKTKADFYAGELVLGGVDGPDGEKFYADDVVYTPLVQDKWYNVIITDVGVAGQSLGVDCQQINTPRSIIDSGTSNMAFPPAVYSRIIAELKTKVRAVLPETGDSFFSDDQPCCSTLCDPTDKNSKIYSLPSVSVSLALNGNNKASKEQITITIPPEYIWRPILLGTNFGTQACRVFGISEGQITLLGDVFMDGLYTVHNRVDNTIGVAVAASCPNNVTSSKKVKVESSSKKICDCVSDADRKGSLLSSYWPFSSKPCFYWLWWMYIVVVCFVLVVICIIALIWIWWQRRRLQKRLEVVREERRARQAAARQSAASLNRSLLSPNGQPNTAPASVMPQAASTAATSIMTLPVVVADDHHHVLEEIHLAIRRRLLPFHGAAIVHVDAHPDLSFPSSLPADVVFQPQDLYDALDESPAGIAEFLLPLLYGGHVSDLVWIKSPWSAQIPTAEYTDIAAGKDAHSGEQCTLFHGVVAECSHAMNAPQHFIEEQLYAPVATMAPDSIRHWNLAVGEDQQPPESSVLKAKLSAIAARKQPYVLDIDLDYFSTWNPFRRGEVLCSVRTGRFVDSALWKDQSIQIDVSERMQSHRQLSCLMQQLQAEQPFRDGNPSDTLTNFRRDVLACLCADSGACTFDALVAVLREHQADNKALELIFAAMPCLDLPDHLSSEEEIADLITRLSALLEQSGCASHSPSMVTIAKSAGDEYLPPHQTNFVLQSVLAMLEKLYGDITVKHIEYEDA